MADPAVAPLATGTALVVLVTIQPRSVALPSPAPKREKLVVVPVIILKTQVSPLAQATFGQAFAFVTRIPATPVDGLTLTDVVASGWLSCALTLEGVKLAIASTTAVESIIVNVDSNFIPSAPLLFTQTRGEGTALSLRLFRPEMLVSLRFFPRFFLSKLPSRRKQIAPIALPKVRRLRRRLWTPRQNNLTSLFVT